MTAAEAAITVLVFTDLLGADCTLIRRLGNSLDPVTRGWAIVAAGSAVRLALGFLASVLIARALGPADFGVYALLAAASSIAGALADLGLSDSAVKGISAAWSTDRGLAAGRGQAFFWLRLAIAGLVFGVGCLLLDPLSRWGLGLPEGGALLALALLGVVATALSGAVSVLLQAAGRFGRLALVMATNSGSTLLLAAALALAGQLNLVTALSVLGIGTSLVSFVAGWRLLPPPLTLAFPGLPLLHSEGRPLLRFGRWLWLSSLLAMVAAQLDLLLVNRWCGSATVGLYGLALNLANKADLVNHSLYTVLLPTASALRDPGAAGLYVRRGLLRSALLLLALLPLFPLAEPLIVFFYGPEYAAAAGLFQLLLGVAIFDLFVSPILLLAFTFNRPTLLAGAEGVRLAVLAAVAATLIPVWGPAGAVAARFCARGSGALLVLAGLRRNRRTEEREPSKAPGA